MRTVPRYIYAEQMRDKIGLNGKHYGKMHNFEFGLIILVRIVSSQYE